MAPPKAPILTLSIDKVKPGLYRAATLHRSVEVTEPQFHCTIEDAIREEALAVPEDFALFMEVEYGGMSSGTISLSDLPGQAKDVADRLVSLVADLHRLMS
jgi:hypothetical protein